MSSYLETAVEIAREAGGLIAHFHERGIGYEMKGDFDLVTEADRESEKLIVERIAARFPSHAIVAEEGGDRAGSSEFKWYEMIAGVVYDPVRQEMFAAERGAGAYLNNHRIHVSKVNGLARSLVASGFPSYKRHLNVNIHYFHQMAMASHGVRRAGSAAIDLVYVACGRLEAFWEIGLKPWDMAAGSIIVGEAGGTVSKMDGSPVDLLGPNILTDNGAIHGEILQLFTEVRAGKYRVPMPSIIPA
jgi:myo-inositol-1(or 4)-monophosphatase